MSVTVGRAKLNNAVKDLMVRWEETKVHWNDARAQQLEREFIEPLTPQSRSALSAMDRLATQLSQAQRDCE